jgi:hypothetical protein
VRVVNIARPHNSGQRKTGFPLTIIPLPRMSEAKRIDRGDVEEMVSVGGEGDAQIDAIWG